MIPSLINLILNSEEIEEKDMADALLIEIGKIKKFENHGLKKGILQANAFFTDRSLYREK